jgi:GTP-binding protein Era
LKKRGIYEYMLKAIYKSIGEADIIVYMTDATRSVEDDETFLNRIQRSKVSKILAINKIDLVKKNELLPKIDHFSKNFGFDEIVPISALSGDGVELLVNLIVKHLPEGPPYFSDDQITDQNERFIAAEIVREKLFMVLKHELPYSVAVDVEEFNERSERLVYIRACIVVEKDSQKPIVIGHGGSVLKRVGQLAREELEMLLSKRVFLELFVKVKKDWTKDVRALRALGFSKA